MSRKNFGLDHKVVLRLFDYDKEAGALVWKVNRCKKQCKGTIAGTLGSHGKRVVKIAKKVYYMNRLVYFWHNGSCPPYIIHLDGDKSNCKIGNLDGNR